MPDITWVEKDFITRRRDHVLTEAWDRFCEAVKHKTRFVIWLLLGSLRREIKFLHRFVEQLVDRVETDHEDIEPKALVAD